MTTDLAAWQRAAAESFERMRAHAVAELTEILEEPVHLDEDGAIVLDADQRRRLLAAVPPVKETEPNFRYESAWGVPIRRAEASTPNHADGGL